MRAILIGAVESSRIALEAIARAPGWHLPLVISLPLDLARRHSDFVDLAPAARAAGADYLEADNINHAEVLEAIVKADADYVFVIGWSQICGAGFRAACRDRVIGYHPAPLPRLRGRAVIPWTILSGEPITGGTLFWIDQGVDSGPILEQAFFHVAPDETAASLYARHMTRLEAMMGRALVALAAGKAQRIPQNERFATFAAKRTPADGVIDWAQDAASIARLVRAVGRPYPGAATRISGKRLVIWRAMPWPDGGRHLASPGQIVERGDEGFAVACGGGTALLVSEWDLEGGGMPGKHAKLGGSSR